MLDSEKENIIENTKNFTPYGTDSEKDKMVKSDYWRNRFTIAKEGYGLDVLINDEVWGIREAVARQGYSLDILINDEHRFVREAVLYYLKKNNLTLAEWYIQNNKEIDLKNLAYSPYPEARAAAIKSGYVYKESEMYIAPDCKFTPYGTNTKKDKMVKSNYWEARLKMAKQGYGLDVLINDEDWNVREAVTKQGYGLDILVNDENWRVRRAVAKQGYGLDILVNDKHGCVRRAVADQGYGLDVLVNDKDPYIRKAVKNYLTSHNLTLEQWKSNQDLSKTNIINQAKNAINDGNIDIKNVADNIKSTESILNDNINKTNKINEIELFKLD